MLGHSLEGCVHLSRHCRRHQGAAISVGDPPPVAVQGDLPLLCSDQSDAKQSRENDELQRHLDRGSNNAYDVISTIAAAHQFTTELCHVTLRPLTN